MTTADTAPTFSSLDSGRVETVEHQGRVLCILVRASPAPTQTEFYTPNDYNLQLGNIVYPAGGTIPRHSHRPVTRTVSGTSEVLVVQRGKMLIDLYDDEKKLVATREMTAGDAIALVSGGHGFRLLEDTVLLEVKQGPYSGIQEKDRF
jgi:quercetin dioxygenase-like cupin family protein